MTTNEPTTRYNLHRRPTAQSLLSAIIGIEDDPLTEHHADQTDVWNMAYPDRYATDRAWTAMIHQLDRLVAGGLVDPVGSGMYWPTGIGRYVLEFWQDSGPYADYVRACDREYLSAHGRQAWIIHGRPTGPLG